MTLIYTVDDQYGGMTSISYLYIDELYSMLRDKSLPLLICRTTPLVNHL